MAIFSQKLTAEWKTKECNEKGGMTQEEEGEPCNHGHKNWLKCNQLGPQNKNLDQKSLDLHAI